MDALSTHLTKSPLCVALLTSGAAVACLLTLRRILGRWKPADLHIANYERDTVYFFTFPSVRTAVTISPFALKLETWLRLHKIRYSAVRRKNMWSRKGQIPFVELNGEEYNESNLIIAKLSDHFGVNDGLTEEQQGCARGLEMMLDNQTFFSIMYYRFVEDTAKAIGTWEYASWIQRKFLILTMPRWFKKRVEQHGIGRNTVPEMYAMGCDDILALSKVLGNKNYLLGNQMTTVDCYAFGHLAQILYNTIDYPHKKFMRERTPNLCEYVARIKERLWPDWDQLCMENLHGTK